jgi:hypothetical protein
MMSALEFAETFPKTLCLVYHPVRCGKPTCRCARGDLHASWRLVWREHGRQHRRYVRAHELAGVRAVIGHRRLEHRMHRLERAIARSSLRTLKQFWSDLQ